MRHIKQALTILVERQYASMSASCQDDFQAFVDCIEKDWEISESDLFLIEKVLGREFASDRLEASIAIQLLIFIRLCAVRNNIPERAAMIREAMRRKKEEQERDQAQ